jgi:hypothetical protein
MAFQDRAQILQDLASDLGFPIISYVTGDRPGMQTQIAAEQLVYFPRHLAAFASEETLGLLLYTRGGETQAAWPIVNFLREHCQQLVILAPFWAHSAGTLMALGANRIIMSKYATLSPIDPTVANAFNPQDPLNPQLRIPIAVEDVMAFFELVKGQSEESSEDMARAFHRLSETVHPLALGNVQRSIDQIRQLAQKMIRLHSPERSEDEITRLVHDLTTGLYSHYHLMGRNEAREIGLPVEDTSSSVEGLLLRYYDQLCADLQLLEKFDPAALLRTAAAPQPTPQQPPPSQMQPGTTIPQQQPTPTTSPSLQIRLERAYIETAQTCDAFVISGVVSQQQQAPPALPPGVTLPPGQVLPTTVVLEVTSEEWEKIA